MILDGEKQLRAVDEEFDYVIVGSGAAGATAARVLADTGASIAVVEEGPLVQTAAFSDRLFPESRRLFRGGGLGGLIARGRGLMSIIQGSCLGGSTVVNSAIVWRMPEDVWQEWKLQYRLGEALPLKDLERNWDQIERELYIQSTPPAVWGENNRLMDVAGKRPAVSAQPIRRNVRDCRGSARCLTGCPFGAKQSMLVELSALRREAGRNSFHKCASGPRDIKGGHGGRSERAFPCANSEKESCAIFLACPQSTVIVAASAIQTPGLLRRSGVRSRHLGEHFQTHPAVGLVGVFDQPVNMWFGATQGYEVDEHRGRTLQGRDGRAATRADLGATSRHRKKMACQHGGSAALGQLGRRDSRRGTWFAQRRFRRHGGQVRSHAARYGSFAPGAALHRRTLFCSRRA